jgi:uncharacterized membrane protein YbhN (UPF0104 family)
MLKDGFIYLFIVGVSLNFIALMLMMVCIFSTRLCEVVINFIFKIFKFFKMKDTDEKKKQILSSLDKYHESSIFIKEHKIEFVKSILRVMIQVMFYFAVPFFVYKSFGLMEYSMLKMFAIQSILFISVSSIPLPGAIGVSETAFLNIYKSIYGETLLGGAMLLSRFISFYIFVFISLIVVIVNMIKHQIK